ncbi:MAG: aspartate 1-decarboxylase [Clostridiales bacterium]|jgi:aspartate 1-decarboxylase|nr:aspartate 1-decarboxylase [Clostridiales bacterium]
MYITALKSKIHRATVTQSALDYVGSITIDEDLMDAAGIYAYEKVQVADVDNGSRLETYVIAGERGSGVICLNGAAARCVHPKDKIIIMAYGIMLPEERKKQLPKVIFVDENNRIVHSTDHETHGRLEAMLNEEKENG